MEVAIPAAALTALLTHLYREPYKAPVKGRSLTKGRKGPSKHGPNSFAPENRADLMVRPPTNVIPSAVPRSVTDKIIWDVVSYDNVINTSTSTVVETNTNFSLNYHPQVTSWIALFDQWCIPQATVTYQSQMPSGVGTSAPILYTALDFDSTTNISTIQAIEDFSTCETHLMSHGATHVRSIRPCNKSSIQVSSGVSNAGMIRSWVDSSYPTALWFGIRSITGSSGTATNIVAKVTVWFAFRNQI